MDTPVLGIDLGTTNSVVSIIEGGKPRVLKIGGESVVPSVVGLDSNGKLLVGFPALNQFALAPDRTVRSIKRKMGSNETVSMGQQTYRPEEISAIILRWLKEQAASLLGRDVERAVITVPAFFNEQQREATRRAGELAGLNVVRIINEPTAASLTYTSRSEAMERLLVYDLGGGTFDVSIIQMEQGVIEVLSSHGDTQLGGDDFDQLLLDFVCDRFLTEHGVDLRTSPSSRSRVLRAVEQAKKQLSFDAFVGLDEEFVAEKDGVPLHLSMELARHDYEEMIEPLLAKTLVCVDEALADAKLGVRKIDRIILVGGASRTPLVHQMLSEQLQMSLHAEVDPDLCVSMGAAVQGGLIDGLDLGPVLVDITPHTLGIGAIGWLYGIESPFTFSPLIERNTPLPANRSQVFFTNHDSQKSVHIDVFQGEHEDVRNNELVGDFRLENMSDVPAGNQILVRFNLDLDGILQVSAMEKATGVNAELTIENALRQARNPDESAEKLDDVFQSAGTRPGDSHAITEPESRPANAPSHPRGGKTRPSVTTDLSPELQPAVDRARELLDQADKLRTQGSPDDQHEFDRMIQRLQDAVATCDRQELENAMDELDDLVFYVQGAS